MSFLLDVICVLPILLAVIFFWKRPWAEALLVSAALLLSLAVATAACRPLSEQLVQPAIRPAVERNAANELADLFSAPHGQDGCQTVQPLPLDQLVEECPVAYQDILKRYTAQQETVAAAFRAQPTGAVLLQSITQPWIRLLSDGACFALLWLMSFLVFWVIARRICRNLPPASPVRGAWHLCSGLIGLVYGALIVCGLHALLCWGVPLLSSRTILISEQAMQYSPVFTAVGYVNPLWYILFG